MRTQPELFGPDVLDGLKHGATVLATDYARARFTQVELRRRYEQIFEDYDILLTPTTPVAAPLCAEFGEVGDLRPSVISFTAPFNLTGLPALSLPGGFTHGGLPIGLQLVARPWAEDRLLRAGYAYEQATSWHERKPEYIVAFGSRAQLYGASPHSVKRGVILGAAKATERQEEGYGRHIGLLSLVVELARIPGAHELFTTHP